MMLVSIGLIDIWGHVISLKISFWWTFNFAMTIRRIFSEALKLKPYFETNLKVKKNVFRDSKPILLANWNIH